MSENSADQVDLTFDMRAVAADITLRNYLAGPGDASSKTVHAAAGLLHKPVWTTRDVWFAVALVEHPVTSDPDREALTIALGTLISEAGEGREHQPLRGPGVTTEELEFMTDLLLGSGRLNGTERNLIATAVRANW